MKTPHEVRTSEQIFIDDFVSHCLVPLIESECVSLKDIARQHLIDLTTIHRGYFSFAVQNEITRQSAFKLAQLKNSQPDIVLRNVWSEIVRDFHVNNYWGLEVQNHKPVHEVPKSKERDAIAYILAGLNSMLVMKVMVLNFGLWYAADPTLENKIYLTLALLGSVLSMAIFAWRQSRKEKSNYE